MGLVRFLRYKALEWALPKPFPSRHQEYSTITYFDENAPSQPTQRLMEICIKAIDKASQEDLNWLSKRMPNGPFLPEIWPGEHYKLLAGLVKVHQPKRVVEIGTWTGLSALAIKHSLPPGSEIITVDIVPWDQVQGTAFRGTDFADGSLKQVIGDLAQPEFFASFSKTLSGCDLVFADGPKDIIFEETLLRNLAAIQLPKNALVFLDDIRQWNMLKIWHEISRPKMDLTSFGHWTGTGIIDWYGAAR